MSEWYIKTRSEFFDVLERTRVEARRIAGGGEFWVFPSIVAQLDAIKSWTADGRTPTQEEKDRITMGYYAVREFDGDEFPELIEGTGGDYLDCLVQLAGYFEEWPDDPQPSGK